MTSVPQDLISRYRAGLVIPFVGAGVSRSVTWQAEGKVKNGLSWDELVDHAASLLGFDPPELLRARGTPLQMLEYFRRVKGSLAPLQNWFYGEMQPPDGALQASAIHKGLAELDRCRVLYTTNFDNFLERGFAIHGRTAHAVVREEDMGHERASVEIVKFHGDLDHPDEMVISESDYESRLALDEPLDLRLRADMLGRSLLFIGYSFRDPNVAYLFRSARGRGGAEGAIGRWRRAYIVLPDPSAFERRLFDARNIEIIGVDSGDIAGGIVSVLEALKG